VDVRQGARRKCTLIRIRVASGVLGEVSIDFCLQYSCCRCCCLRLCSSMPLWIAAVVRLWSIMLLLSGWSAGLRRMSGLRTSQLSGLRLWNCASGLYYHKSLGLISARHSRCDSSTRRILSTFHGSVELTCSLVSVGLYRAWTSKR